MFFLLLPSHSLTLCSLHCLSGLEDRVKSSSCVCNLKLSSPEEFKRPLSFFVSEIFWALRGPLCVIRESGMGGRVECVNLGICIPRAPLRCDNPRVTSHTSSWQLLRAMNDDFSARKNVKREISPQTHDLQSFFRPRESTGTNDMCTNPKEKGSGQRRAKGDWRKKEVFWSFTMFLVPHRSSVKSTSDMFFLSSFSSQFFGSASFSLAKKSDF